MESSKKCLFTSVKIFSFFKPLNCEIYFECASPFFYTDKYTKNNTYIKNHIDSLKVPKSYEKCLRVSSSVKGKSLPAPPSGREWAMS